MNGSNRLLLIESVEVADYLCVTTVTKNETSQLTITVLIVKDCAFSSAEHDRFSFQRYFCQFSNAAHIFA